MPEIQVYYRPVPMVFIRDNDNSTRGAITIRLGTN